MFSAEFRALVATTSRTMRFVWAALAVSPLLYAPAVFLAVRVDAFPAPGAVRWVVGAAIILACASLVARQVLLSSGALQAALQRPLPAYPGLAERVQPLSPPERRVYTALLYMQVPTIICLSLNEAVAVSGLVLGVVSTRPLWSLPCLAVATVLNLLVYPNVERTADDLWEASLAPPAR